MTTMNHRGHALGALVVLALLLGVAGCGGSTGGSSILLYNGQHPQVTTELVAAFEKQTHQSRSAHERRYRSRRPAIAGGQLISHRCVPHRERRGIKPNPQITPLTKIAPAALSPTVLGNDLQASQLIKESGLA
jgi:hypothetical protein